MCNFLVLSTGSERVKSNTKAFNSCNTKYTSNAEQPDGVPPNLRLHCTHSSMNLRLHMQQHIVHTSSYTYCMHAPINVMPHYPLYRLCMGQSGDLTN